MGDSIAACRPTKSSLQLLQTEIWRGDAGMSSMLAMHGQLPHSGSTELRCERQVLDTIAKRISAGQKQRAGSKDLQHRVHCTPTPFKATVCLML